MMRWPVGSLLAMIAVVLAGAKPLSGQDTDQVHLSVEQLLSLEQVSNPVVHPDGSLVAYAVAMMDFEENQRRSAVWMVPLVESAEPRRMTSLESSSTSPRFSPDGRVLSFLSRRDDDEDAKAQVWTLDLGGGEAQQLTEVEQGVEAYEWAPDGGRLALVIRDAEPEREEDAPQPPWVIDRLQFKRDYEGYLDRRRPHLYVLDLGTGRQTKLTSGDYDHASPMWSPDGNRIAFVSNRTAEPDGNYDTDIWVVGADGDSTASPVRVSMGANTDAQPIWSPDGSMIAWITRERPEIGGYATPELAIALPGEPARILTEGVDRAVRDHAFSSDGTMVMAVIETQGENQLIAVPTGGGTPVTLLEGARHVDAAEANPLGGVVVAVSNAERPANLWFVNQGGEGRQITHHNSEVFDGMELGRVSKELVTSPDGAEFEAFFTFPPGEDGSRALPTILWIHGGPMSQDDWGWHPIRQLFAAHGYLVIQPNYRGSYGYGQDFALEHWANWGSVEPMDAVAAVDHAIERGWADPDRLGVGGWSYGGITTNAIITTTDRFKAAVSGASGALWVAGYGHDEYQLWYELEFGLPWENRELWERLSTFNRVDAITTPTLWIGGEDDWNVPIHDSELMYQAMKRLGRETMLVVYPGQHHGQFAPYYEDDRYRRFLGWFGRYLIDDGSAWPTGEPVRDDPS